MSEARPNIRGYRLEHCCKAELQGANTNTVRDPAYNRSSSYTVGFMGTGDGHLWAGRLRRERLDPPERVRPDQPEHRAHWPTSTSTQSYAPKKTQGVTVTSTASSSRPRTSAPTAATSG